MNEQYVPATAQAVQPQPSVDYNIFIQELTTMKKSYDLFLNGMEEIKDKDGEVTFKQTSKAYMNINGRKAVMSWVNCFINPNVYLAENKEHNVLNNYKLDNLNMLDMLFMNLNEFELTIDDAKTIHSELCGMVHHALMRSMTDKKYIFPTIKTTYDPNQPQQEKPRLFGLFG